MIARRARSFFEKRNESAALSLNPGFPLPTMSAFFSNGAADIVQLAQQIRRKNSEADIGSTDGRQRKNLPSVPAAKAERLHEIHPGRHVEHRFIKQRVKVATAVFEN